MLIVIISKNLGCTINYVRSQIWEIKKIFLINFKVPVANLC